MDRRFGIPLATAQQQLQRVPPASTVPVRLLPAGAAGRATPKDLGFAESSPLMFCVVGDNGGIKSPFPQEAVFTAIAHDQDQPCFVWHEGDWVYFGADPDQWGPQLYEPAAKVHAPIIGGAGNHDDAYGGDPPFDPSRTPLDQWMLNLCAPHPGLPPADPHNEYGRDTVGQPFCDWTLAADAITITTVWTNVPSGGHLYPEQTAWLTAELKAAPTDRPLVVSLHHPPYSIDAHHGGSQLMGTMLDQCFHAAGRAPDMVLAGHVHNYQRFTRTFPTTRLPEAHGQAVPYIVIGNSGYWHLHGLAPGAQPGETVGENVTFEFGDDHEYGYLKFKVDGMTITGEYVGVSTDAMGNPTTSPRKDTFTIEGRTA
jgi:hypothetical protein